ncbi:DNA polymerase, partial [Hungatella hathewayi]|uniref:DNA polymerase n=1 Tax=Hungatella hathewayi TaxID=154046 RepID=UPI00321C21AA
MHHLSIDIETRSSVDIGKAGAYKYAQSPDFEILLFAYQWNNDPVKVIDLKNGEELPCWLMQALADPNVIKHAYNAAFEWYCLNCAGYETPIEQWRCTMAHGLYCGYTAGLDATGKAIGLPQDKQKLTTGKALIRYFCVPCKPTKTNGSRTWNQPWHDKDKWDLFKEYCKQDVVTEREILKRLDLFPMPEEEERLWQMDVLMNAYGVRVDTDLIEGALYIDQISTQRLTDEAISLTGLQNPNSAAQLLQWLRDNGTEADNLQKATVAELLGGINPNKVRRMLEIRQQLGKTSIKKYVAMDTARGEGDRVRGLTQYYGANRTGRWAGRLVQMQNLPRNYLKTLDYARNLVKAKNYDGVKILYGNVPDTLSQLIRTAFIPSSGHKFVVADFSAIEARVIAWLAGEQWVNEVFATHGKIYEATASQMFGVPVERIAKGNPEYSLRQKGKVATLALGYQGGTSA